MPDSLPTPVTRKESYLAKAAGMSVALPAYPVTREEQYLAAIAEGGGGGGSGATIVSFSKSGDNIVCDTSIADILTAAAAGPVFGVVNATVFSADNVVGTLVLHLQERNATFPTEVTFLGDYHRESDGTVPETTGIASLYGYTILGADRWTAEYTPVDPLEVTYTVTGQPVDGVYPLSVDTSISSIFAAVSANRDVKAKLTVGDDNLHIPMVSNGTSGSTAYAAYSCVTQFSGAWGIFQITHTVNNYTVTASGSFVPLSTVQMTYTAATQTRAITG